MIFVSSDHKENFNRLMNKFPQAGSNRRYMSACYVAAFPHIFKCFNVNKQVFGPYDWYFDCMENGKSEKGSTAPLTGGTRRLVELAVNLWNGQPFDLSEGLGVWDRESYQVAMQAIELRWIGQTW